MYAYHRLSLLRKLEVGSRKLEVGSWKSEVGSRKSEVGSRKLEVGSRKSEDPPRLSYSNSKGKLSAMSGKGLESLLGIVKVTSAVNTDLK